jgi:hypothetical protein
MNLIFRLLLSLARLVHEATSGPRPTNLTGYTCTACHQPITEDTPVVLTSLGVRRFFHRQQCALRDKDNK